MKSYFITGTDTDVGKTYFTAGLASVLSNLEIDVGIMKPFAAGSAQESGYKSEDAQIIANAAGTNDPESLVNPLFFPIPASPYTAEKNNSISIKADIELVLNNFRKLSSMHEMLLVEGMGGLMTPILKNYFVANLINDMDLDSIVVTRNRIGTLNHTIMTCQMAKKYGIHIRGIVINQIDSDGYETDVLKNDIEDITGISVLGYLPSTKIFDLNEISKTIKDQFNLKLLLD